MNGIPIRVHAPFMRAQVCFQPMVSRLRHPATPEAGLRRRTAVGLAWGLCCGLGLISPAAEAERDSSQRARAAHAQGRIVPLEQLIAQVAQKVPGRLLEAELDDDDGLLVYELRWQLADGRRLEIELDAHDGRWRKLKGPRLETVFKPTTPGAAYPAPGPRAGR